jgi:hypothetical protein
MFGQHYCLCMLLEGIDISSWTGGTEVPHMCQKCEVKNHHYGHLPPKKIDTLIHDWWDTVHIDLKGPYHIDAL